MAGDDLRPHQPDADPYAALGGCDWGNCNGEVVGQRYDPEHGYLPVCADHEADDQHADTESWYREWDAVDAL